MKWTGLLLLIAVLVVTQSAGAQEGADDPAQVDAGRAVFEANCASCHSSDGTGSTVGRPLTDIAAQQPDRSVHIESVTNGKGTMPPFGTVLSADEIDSVVSYVRLGFVSEAAQEEEPAAEEPTETLADTGTESGLVAVVGITLAAAGLMLAATRRRLGPTG